MIAIATLLENMGKATTHMQHASMQAKKLREFLGEVSRDSFIQVQFES